MSSLFFEERKRAGSRPGTGLSSQRPGEPGNLALAGRNVFGLGLLVWLLVASAYHGAVTADGRITGIDFAIFYHAAQRLNQGLPLYQPQGELYAYSPLLALLIRPLAHFPLGTALKVWFAFNAAYLVLSVVVYGAAARMTWRDAAPLGVMLLVGFRFWPTTMNFALGQSNFLLLLLLSGMFWADSRRNLTLLGLLVGFAALFKIWMLGLLVYPLLRRQWLAVAAAVVACGLAFTALFTLIGWHEFPAFWQAGLSTSRQISRISITHSLFGFARLHFHDNSLVDPLTQSSLIYGAVLLVGVALIGFGLFSLWRRCALTPFESRLSLGLVAVSALLLLPPCQNEYLVLCLPLLWTLIAPADAEGEALPFPLMMVGWLAYGLFSRGWGPYAPVPAAYHHGLKSLLVSTGFFAACLLWGAGMIALRRRPSPQRAGIFDPAGSDPL